VKRKILAPLFSFLTIFLGPIGTRGASSDAFQLGAHEGDAWEILSDGTERGGTSFGEILEYIPLAMRFTLGAIQGEQGKVGFVILRMPLNGFPAEAMAIRFRASSENPDITYSVSLGTNLGSVSRGEISFQADFIPSEIPQDFVLPIEAFTAFQRGRPIPQSFDPGSVQSIGIHINRSRQSAVLREVVPLNSVFFLY
jgi:hypothetical protein